jgi:hypothetical protein
MRRRRPTSTAKPMIRRLDRASRAAAASGGHPGPQDRYCRGLQGRPADPLARGLRQTGRVVRRPRVSFASVTQQFNTTTSMGRLTLEEEEAERRIRQVAVPVLAPGFRQGLRRAKIGIDPRACAFGMTTPFVLTLRMRKASRRWALSSKLCEKSLAAALAIRIRNRASTTLVPPIAIFCSRSALGPVQK